MKRFIQFFFAWLAAGMLVLALSACQAGPMGSQSADTGLVPDQASTGDPPLIPHDVEESDGGEECLGCHEDGEDAPKIPEWHATLTDCRQCHVPFVEGNAIFKTEY